jgi:hypothetical protein
MFLWNRQAMKIRAVFFDFGGVIQRTEYQAPRQHLAERFGMDYEDIDKLVFASESARRASMGEITEEVHWQNVLKRLKRPETELQKIESEFFGGDVVDRDLVNLIRGLRGKVHTGLISNAWSGISPKRGSTSMRWSRLELRRMKRSLWMMSALISRHVSKSACKASCSKIHRKP